MQRKRQNRGQPSFDEASIQVERELLGTYIPKKTSRNGVLVFKVALLVLVCAAVVAVSHYAFGVLNLVTVIAVLLAGWLAVSCVHMALAWEKVVVLRLGRFNRVKGPGIFLTIPILEYGTIRVDQRIITTPFSAEKTLTLDLVPLNIDAVLYWMVWDPEKACMEVEDYFAAVSFLAQTAMRDAIGRSTVAQVAMRREQLDVEIRSSIEKRASNWGIDIISVKVRDIVLPDELQEVMTLEAQAEREKNARMTLAAIEGDIADILADAAKLYNDPDAALKLRTLQMLYETVRKSKGTVVTIPSAVSDGLGAEAVERVASSLRQ